MHQVRSRLHSQQQRSNFTSLPAEHGDTIAVEDAVRGKRTDAVARGHDAGQIERISRTESDELPALLLAPDRSKLAYRLGQGKLLPRHPGHEAATPNLTPGLESPVHHQQFSPCR